MFRSLLNINTRNRYILLVVILLSLVTVTGYFIVLDSQKRLIENQAVQVAEIVAIQASAARSVYSKDVLEKIKKDGTGFADIDFHAKQAAIPLPAQFVKKVAVKASQDTTGLFKYRSVSKWNLAEGQGLNNEFLQDAWKKLEAQNEDNPSGAIQWKPAFSVQNYEGKDSLLYLKADPASGTGCVSCHMNYEQMPHIQEKRISQGIPTGKKWKQHQLLGAIFVQIPLESMKSFALKESSQTIFWILTVLMGGIVFFSSFIVGDVSKAKEATKQLIWQTQHDGLTGLPNRFNFEERTTELIARAKNGSKQTHAMCFLDLDQFKVVNDTCGHATGDLLLCQITRELQTKIQYPNILARLGGDEFGILIENCSIEKVAELTAQLCEKIKNYHFIWKDHSFDIGVSIGVVEINNYSKSTEKVMQSADLACFAAKEAGRNRVHIYKEDDVAMTLRKGEMVWVSGILKAIEENRIVIFSQSIQSMEKNTKHKHYEILVRLIDEKGNIVSPNEFLPAAERYDLMPKLDLVVLERAFKALKDRSFSQLGNEGFISINLSGQSLSNEDFISQTRALLNKYDVNPKQICFEITESTAISNSALVLNFMEEMKAMGIRFALDDFGTGLSSLTYLKQFPVDYLKIDGSFISDIASDKVDRTLVDAINKMAHTMGLKTVAEYAESDEILKVLKELKIDYAQGYVIDCPSKVS